MQTPPQPQDAAPHEAEPETGEPWLEDLGELPPRPRRRLLSPAPLALLGVLLTACGFIGGVLVEKGQNGSGTSSAPSGAFASRLRALASAGATGASGAGAAAAAAGGPGSGRPTSGTVSFTSGGTLYLADAEGNTVKVATSAGTSVTKTVKASARAIRPGETVTVTGTTAADGTVHAQAIRVGVTGGLGALFGAGAGGTSGTAGGSSGTGSSTATPQLFGN